MAFTVRPPRRRQQSSRRRDVQRRAVPAVKNEAYDHAGRSPRRHRPERNGVSRGKLGKQERRACAVVVISFTILIFSIGLHRHSGGRGAPSRQRASAPRPSIT